MVVASVLPSVLPPTVQQNPNTGQIETLNVQQNKLREQIRQSELNLQAQHSVRVNFMCKLDRKLIFYSKQVLLTQQQSQIDAAVKIAQSELLQRQADEAGIKLMEFDEVLQPIIESCTKDSISNGK